VHGSWTVRDGLGRRIGVVVTRPADQREREQDPHDQVVLDRPAAVTSGVDTIDKIELHCHLDGLLGPAMLAELDHRGIATGVDRDALAAAVPVRSHAHWLDTYVPLVEHAVRDANVLAAMLEIHVASLVAQRASYAELMVSGLLPGAEADVIERFERLRAAADRASGVAIRVELLVAIGRGPIERAQRQVDRILALARRDLIAGVAIAGDERAATIAELAPAIDRCRDAGLGIEIHAGEVLGAESVWDALEHGRPDRIGHGIGAFGDERLLDALAARNTHLELCPTSNLRLGVVADLAHHPLGLARDRGLSFSINTDDPGPFACTLTSEYELAAHTFGCTSETFSTLRDNAWRARFGP
jgi:adenosine deaminase